MTLRLAVAPMQCGLGRSKLGGERQVISGEQDARPFWRSRSNNVWEKLESINEHIYPSSAKRKGVGGSLIALGIASCMMGGIVPLDGAAHGARAFSFALGTAFLAVGPLMAGRLPHS